MGLFLKVSTAVTVKIGPFVDETNGKDAETGLTLTQGDIRLSKNGGDMAQKHEANNATHDEIGYYDCPIDADDTDTLGRLQLMVHESGALPVYHEYMVVTANFYDTVCGSDYLQTDLTQIGGVAQSATDLKDLADTGYDPTTHKVQGVVLTDTTTTNTDLTAFATNYTAARAGYLDELAAANLPTDIANVAASIAALNDIDADAVWDEVMDTNAPANANTARKIINVIASAVSGKLSGGGTNTLTFRDLGDTKDRITVSVDASKNRTAVTADGT